MRKLILLAFSFSLFACGNGSGPAPEPLDTILSGGTVYSGDNVEGVVADVGIAGDRIVRLRAAEVEWGHHRDALV